MIKHNTLLNRTLRFFGLIAIFFMIDATYAAPPFVRVWEGTKPADVSNDAFYAFLSQVLIPTTVSANPNSIQAYLPVILDLNQPLPPDAFLKKLPFHEAALVVHQSEQTYNDARRDNPWYGPAHFLKGGGFDDKVSFSAGPKVFPGVVEVATLANRVSFDLRDPANSSTADWQTGHVLVSVILRKQSLADADYLMAVSQYAEAIKKELAGVLDGHFIRVGPGHILEFMRFSGQAEYERSRALLDQISVRFNSGFIFDYYRKPVEPTPHGAIQAGPGRAFSVRFERPFKGCGGTLAVVAKQS